MADDSAFLSDLVLQMHLFANQLSWMAVISKLKVVY